MMLQVLLDLAVGFLVESVVGSPTTHGREFQREMHRYLDQRSFRGSSPRPCDDPLVPGRSPASRPGPSPPGRTRERLA